MYLPEFKGPIEGWVVNQLKRNGWRFDRTMDRDDILQEAYVVFMRCFSKYPMTDTPQHFMSLFQRAWTNHVNDLSVKATKNRFVVPEAAFTADDDSTWVSDSVGDLDNEGQLLTMIRQAPTEVAMVLNLFLNAPQELLELAATAWARRHRGEPNSDEMARTLLGLPDGAAPVSATRKYFSGH